MPLIDAHNHLQDPRIYPQADAIIAQMRAVGIEKCIVNGTQPTDWPKVAALAEKFPQFIIPAFGLHPWQSANAPAGWLDQLAGYLEKFPHSLVGECGLDRWIKGFDIDLQKTQLIQQIQLANQLGRSITIHCLKAWGPLMEIFDALEKSGQPCRRPFLLHSYSGSKELAPQLVKRGAYFSISSYFLHERKSKAFDAFRAVPADRLLIETDAPDMLGPPASQKFQLDGNLNHPANLAQLATLAAARLEIDENTFITQCWANTQSFLSPPSKSN